VDGISITVHALGHLNRQTQKEGLRFNFSTSRM